MNDHMLRVFDGISMDKGYIIGFKPGSLYIYYSYLHLAHNKCLINKSLTEIDRYSHQTTQHISKFQKSGVVHVADRVLELQNMNSRTFPFDTFHPSARKK